MKESRKYIFANKREKRKVFLILPMFCLMVAIACACFFAGNYIATKGVFLVKTSPEVVSTAGQINDRSKYSALFTVRDKLIEKFDGDIDDDVLLEGAIKGMTKSLNDQYTVFMNNKEFDDLMKQSSGNITGIGVTVTLKDDKVTIIETTKGAPAERVGLKENDIIEKINDTDVSGNDLSKATSMIVGANGSELKLTIKRAGSEDFDVSVVPEKVKIESVKSNMIDSSTGYIRIMTFMNENTTEDFKTAIESLRTQGMKGLILDLRENPGGLLVEAVGVASQFIPKDKIITYTIDKYNNRNDSLSVGGIAEGIPLVILVNENSASASEVVTGALRDYGAATIVGKTTFGKGIVQQSFKFNDGIGGLKVTVSKYYTPNGENIHKKGITPDVEVATPVGINENGYDKNSDDQLKAAILKIQEKMQ
ncbi:S41 family peptidase [Clostridium chromiireducens]|uniref:Carboxy-terminal processing protease CtpA n=1 Tax=Clostridium chromiireducens TaxID=225345 RepID=A0A1V4J1B5_9CLOT|nr:S41 family peptidase [Clostridium chromiireducens]OPJ65804.1 carboxy-terminal processing protease CtpA precursor [Clostridium chromiireducens]RII36742.1 S41 family peptidase [Clostridium chromiireducens]